MRAIQDRCTEDKFLQDRWYRWIMTTFQNRPCVFGSLVYSYKPHGVEIPKSACIYAEQVIRRSCKSHGEPLRRIFVAEETAGEEIRRTRGYLLPKNREIHHQFIGQQSGLPVSNQMPDIPHLHFVMEVPQGIHSAEFTKLCEARWNHMNRNTPGAKMRLSKVEVVCNLGAVARYITKEFVKSQGQNIILTHATMLTADDDSI